MKDENTPEGQTEGAVEADLGRYLTLSLAGDGIGNAVLSPEEPSEKGYWTLIGSGDNDYQNRVGRLILAALASKGA